MILDSKLEICDATAVSAVAGTAAVGNVIDLDTIGRRLGSTQNISLFLNVSTAFASAGAATVAFQLVSDSTTTLAADGTETLHWQSETFAYTALTAGASLHVRIPGGIPNAERYLGLQVVTGAATTTAGAINAALVLDAQDWTALADAVN